MCSFIYLSLFNVFLTNFGLWKLFVLKCITINYNLYLITTIEQFRSLQNTRDK